MVYTVYALTLKLRYCSPCFLSHFRVDELIFENIFELLGKMDKVRVRMNSKNEAEMIFERSRQWHGPRRSATNVAVLGLPR